jgi:hypothetical protein
MKGTLGEMKKLLFLKELFLCGNFSFLGAAQRNPLHVKKETTKKVDEYELALV